MEMEMAHVRNKTRTRRASSSLTVKKEEEATGTTTSPKRRKIINNNTNLSPSSFIHINTTTTTTTTTTSNGSSAPEERCSSPISDDSPASCCSSNGSFVLDENIIKFSDPEVESTQFETSTCDCGGEQITRREMSLRTNSQEVESSMENKNKNKKKKKNPTTLSTLQKTPTESELEEFFTTAEKDIQKRFQYKYNYDIVKDVPLEGRYEWVQLKP